jgi:photosystem II stability/assembly factor-like uncharacterized protein
VLGDPFASSADRGVYRTADGGKTWSKTLFVNGETGVADLASTDKTPQTIYAAMGTYRRNAWSTNSGGSGSGLYKSADGGASWQRANGLGLPQEPYGRIGLAVAPSNPKRVYALVETKGTNGIPGAMYRSDDDGGSWTLATHNTLIDERPFYYTRVFVDPADENHVWTTTVHLTESNNGATSFHVTGRGLHGDHHAMWISSDARRIIEANDGGAAFSFDDGATWEWRNVVPIAQLYHIGYDRQNPYTICAPLQDNGAWCAPNNGLGGRGISAAQWRAVGGGDGTWSVPDPLDSHIVWSTFGGQNFQGDLEIFDTRTSESYVGSPYLHDQNVWHPKDLKYRLNWETPVAFDPFDGHIAYLGGNVLFASRDRARHWRVISPDLTRNLKAHQLMSGGLTLDVTGAETTGTILAVEPSTVKRGQVWVGTDDGFVQLTRDGGAHWRNVTPTSIRNATDARGWGRFASLSPSNRDAATAYAVYDAHMLGDRAPHVFVTHDYGAHWNTITAGLPAADEARSIREDPRNPNVVYLGLENGLWLSLDGGAHWRKFNNNLPAVSIRDIRVQPDFNDILLATHGRSVWILDDATPVQRFAKTQGTQTVLFPVRAAYLYNTQSSWRTLRTDGQSPAYGAIVNYKLERALKEAPTAEVLDASGRVVRRFHETGKEALPNAAGVNRFTWDLNEDKPEDWTFTTDWNQGASGVPVVPGRYTLVLHAGAQTLRETLEVKQDPRTHHTLAEMRAAQSAMREVLDDLGRVDEKLNVLSRVISEAPVRAEALKADPALAARVRAAGEEAHRLLLTITQDPKNDQDNDFLTDILRERLQTQIASYESFAQPTQAQLEENRVLTALTNERLARVTAFERGALKQVDEQIAQAKQKPLTVPTVNAKRYSPGGDGDAGRRGGDDGM